MSTLRTTLGWLAGLAVALGLAALMVWLGFWQLDRLEQKRTRNTRILAAIDAPPLVLDVATDPANAEYRRVVVRGTYDYDHEVLLRNRSLRGRPGYHVLTPLRMDGGLAVLVDRGWVPMSQAGQPAVGREAGPVEVQGIVRRSQAATAGRLGPEDPTASPAGAPLAEWFFPSVERIDAQIPYDLLPLYIEREVAPANQELPVPDPQIALTEGNHLSYAFQWFGFAATTVIGYLAFWWHSRRRPGQPPPAMPGEPVVGPRG